MLSRQPQPKSGQSGAHQALHDTLNSRAAEDGTGPGDDDGIAREPEQGQHTEEEAEEHGED